MTSFSIPLRGTEGRSKRSKLSDFQELSDRYWDAVPQQGAKLFISFAELHFIEEEMEAEEEKEE